MEEKNKVDLIKETIESPARKPIVENPQEKDRKTSSGFIGEAFTDDEKINELDINSKPKVIVLLGFVGYGKTSFVASFYHQFLLHGNIDGYNLVDSDTLTGLERRLYLRRLQDSQQVNPVTKRTLRGDGHILTFKLHHPEEGEKMLVISDRSGEVYEQYAAQEDSVNDDKLLRNADRILFFVDSGLLVDNHVLTLDEQYKDLAENLFSHKVIGKDTELDLLFNKIDKIDEQNRTIFEKEKENLIGLLKKRLERNFTNIYEIISNREDDEKLNEVFKSIVATREPMHYAQDISKRLDWVKQIFKI